MRHRLTLWLAAAVLAGPAGATGLQAAPPPAAPLPGQASTVTCVGALPTALPAPRPGGPALRFGIAPGAQAGQLGPLPAAAAPDVPARTLAALGRLRVPGHPFVLRLTRLFWSAGDPGVRAFAVLVHRYTAAGYDVELQLRYHPPAGHDGDVAGFARWVRTVVDRLGGNRRVVGLQVTNEANFAASPDSSDGAYTNAAAAVVAGVEAAKAQARRDGFGWLSVGFNWFYRTDPVSESRFWGYLGAHGGAAFRRAVDWVGLDVYPGTFFPPVTTDPRSVMVNAFSVLRNCYLPAAGLGRAPIRVMEAGWPTSPPVRSYAHQESSLVAMVQATWDYRRTYGVTDFRWFDLRDADSADPNPGQQYGLLTSDYRAKPAFAGYHDLMRRLLAQAG